MNRHDQSAFAVTVSQRWKLGSHRFAPILVRAEPCLSRVRTLSLRKSICNGLYSVYFDFLMRGDSVRIDWMEFKSSIGGQTTVETHWAIKRNFMVCFARIGCPCFGLVLIAFIISFWKLREEWNWRFRSCTAGQFDDGWATVQTQLKLSDSIARQQALDKCFG